MKNLFQFIDEGKAPKVEPVGDEVVIGGKQTKIKDTDKLVGKDEDKTRGVFSIDSKADDSVMDIDGEPTGANSIMVGRNISKRKDFFIVGHAGWGKSSIIKSVAKYEGMSVITVYLDKAYKEDLGGIPIVSKNKKGNNIQEVILPGWAQYIYDNPDKDILLFFDEMNQATPDVQNALMPIILEHEVCGIKMDNFMVGAAGNYADENQATNDLSTPLLSRFKGIMIWKDNDDESWDIALKHLKKKWGNAFEGRGIEIIEVAERYSRCFKNPRELESTLFIEIENALNRAKRTGRPINKNYFSTESLEDELLTLFVKTTDASQVQAEKEEILSSYENRKAISALVSITQKILFAEPSETTKPKDKALGNMLSNEDLQNYIKVCRGGFFKYKDELVIISRDNIQTVFNLTRTQLDQIENLMGDPAGSRGYKYQTEKEAKSKNKKLLSFEEACELFPDLK